jgi:uncharacterized membrane protein YbhN (UPF0104 family)
MKSERPGEEGPAPSRRRWTRLAIRVVGSVVILAALVAFVSPRELAAAVGRLTPEVMVPALSVYLVLHLLGTLKWRIMINAAGAGLAWGHAVRCYYAGLFANTFLVSLVGGDVVRAGMAIPHCRSKAGLFVGSFVDRLFDVVGLVAIAGAGVLWMPGLFGDQGHRVFRGLLLMAAVGAAGTAGLYAALPARRLPYKVRRLLVRARVAAHAVVRRPNRVLAAIGLGIVLQASLVVMNAWLGDACGSHIALWAWFFAWPLAKIASMVPVSLGGLGVREAALVSLLVPLGADAATIMAAGLAFEAVIIGGGLIGGLISALLAAGTAHRFPWPRGIAAGRSQEPSTVSEP